ncbi:MAG: GNAT family N-acetyltransferase [Deinococcota bacterium]
MLREKDKPQTSTDDGSSEIRYRRIVLRPLTQLDNKAWRRVHNHFKDPEIAHLNGTPPSRMPLWLLRRVLKADSRRADRQTYGIFNVAPLEPDELAPNTQDQHAQDQYVQAQDSARQQNANTVSPTKSLNLAVTLNDNGRLTSNPSDYGEYIGTIELYDLSRRSATLGIIIGERRYWGKGYGSEAIQALLHHAFTELKLDEIRLHTFADNLRAQACFKKVGFIETRRVPAGNSRTDVQMHLAAEVWRYQYGTRSASSPQAARWEELG